MNKRKMNLDQFPKVYLYRRVVQAKLYIDSHFSESIKLEQIAGEAYYSKFHFTRLFKKTYGKTPHQYLTYVRIENTKKLLSERRSVSEVCFSVGFSSVSSFTALFKELELMTPSEYQQIQIKRKQVIFAEPLKFIPNCFAEKKGWTKNSKIQEVV